MRLVTYIAVLSLVVACGTDGTSAPETTTTTITGPTTTPAQDTTTTEFATDMSLPDNFPAALLEEIMADTADRTGVGISEVEVSSIEAKTFNDAALGCPEPGKMYAQVLTPGFIVLLQAGGSELDYRVAEGSASYRLCE